MWSQGIRSTGWLLAPARAALAAFALALAVPAAQAEVGGLPTAVGHADSSRQWEKLRTSLFGTRPIDASQGVVQVIVPLRAAYGASVPVKIVSRLPQTPELYVKKMWVLVDKNPSPLAAVLDLTPEVGQADFETRLRVDEYSHVRVVSELSNGELHMDSRYVKVSGGCSAPPNRDQLASIGKTQFKLPDGVKMNAPTTADVQVVHPNDTGFELNNITVMYIPPHFVRSIKVSYAGRKVFDAELDFSIAENPALRFNFVPHADGQLRAEVEDTKEGRFTGVLDVR
jgi:sulfur-oxidizing protein SoxY